MKKIIVFIFLFATIGLSGQNNNLVLTFKNYIPNSTTNPNNWANRLNTKVLDVQQEGLQLIISFENKLTELPAKTLNSFDEVVEVKIPDSVTSIGSDAFRQIPTLRKVELGKNVSIIGNGAFYGCRSLQSINLENVQEIHTNAFAECSSLRIIEIPKTTKFIGNCVWLGCTSLTSIIIDPQNMHYDSRENCNAIIHKEGNILIQGCSATIIPEGTRKIDDYAFYNMGITNIKIPESVESIGYASFADCNNLETVEISDGLVSIGQSAFLNCAKVKTITIPKSVKTIKDAAFAGSSIKSIVIPEGVQFIGRSTFCCCWKLEEVTLPSSINKIEEDCFKYCLKLTNINLKAENPPKMNKIFGDRIPENVQMAVPQQSIDTYKQIAELGIPIVSL